MMKKKGRKERDDHKQETYGYSPAARHQFRQSRQDRQKDLLEYKAKEEWPDKQRKVESINKKGRFYQHFDAKNSE